MGLTAAVRSGTRIGILHAFMASSYPELDLVLPELTLRRSYWTVVHEELRGIRRISVVADFLTEIVARGRTLFSP